MGYIQIGDYWYAVEFILIALGVTVFLLWGASLAFEASNRPAPAPPRTKTPEELDQEAVRLRAETRLLDAQAENAVARAAFDDAKKFLSGRR